MTTAVKEAPTRGAATKKAPLKAAPKGDTKSIPKPAAKTASAKAPAVQPAAKKAPAAKSPARTAANAADARAGATSASASAAKPAGGLTGDEPKLSREERLAHAKRLPPYKGTFDYNELALGVEGGMLFGHLRGRMKELNHSWKEAAAYIGVTSGHLQQLRSGHKSLQQTGNDVLADIAAYLGIARGPVLLMTDRISSLDFEDVDMSEALMQKALELLAGDVTWGSLFGDDLPKLPKRVKVGIVRLYETVMGKEFLGPTIAQSLASQSEVNDLIQRSGTA